MLKKKSELSGECEVPGMALGFALRRCDQLCNLLDLFCLFGLLLCLATFEHLATARVFWSLHWIF